MPRSADHWIALFFWALFLKNQLVQRAYTSISKLLHHLFHSSRVVVGRLPLHGCRIVGRPATNQKSQVDIHYPQPPFTKPGNNCATRLSGHQNCHLLITRGLIGFDCESQSKLTTFFSVSFHLHPNFFTFTLRIPALYYMRFHPSQSHIRCPLIPGKE